MFHFISSPGQIIIPFTISLLLGLMSLLQPSALAVSLEPADSLSHLPPAPSSSTPILTLSTEAPILPTHNGQTLATATVRDASGQPVVGAVIQFTSTLGTMAPASATTNAGGMATSTFTAGPMPGQASITAAYDDLSQSVTLLLQTPQVTTLSLEVDRGQLSIGEQLIATVSIRDQFNRPASGELVSLFGSLGAISSASSLSDDNGQVTAHFTAGNRPGQATLTALSGYSSASVTLTITNPSPSNLPNSIYLPVVLKG